MTLWHVILLASAATLALKLAGHLVPAGFLERERPARIADLLTVALLAALIAVQTLGAGQSLVVDARVPAVIVAAALYAVRTPFIVVVAVAALVAAGIRFVARTGRDGCRGVSPRGARRPASSSSRDGPSRASS